MELAGREVIGCARVLPVADIDNGGTIKALAHSNKPPMLTTMILFLAVIAIAFVVFIKLKSGTPDDASSYKAKNIMTANELEFLDRLEAATPEIRFHSQVAMGAIVEPSTSRRGNGKEYMRLRGKVSQKVIDFVAQDRKTGKIIALIELDDKTHQNEKDAARDAITSEAGYKTIRWHSKNKPSSDEIQAKLGRLAT